MEQINKDIETYVETELSNMLVYLNKQDIIKIDNHEIKEIIKKYKKPTIEVELPKTQKKVKTSKESPKKVNQEVTICEFVLQKGKNKGERCTKKALKDEKACKGHLEKYKEEQQRIIDDEQNSPEELRLDPELERELFGSDSDEEVNNIIE